MTVPGNTPTTDAQWARKVEQRLRNLEGNGPTRVGNWTLSDEAGTLSATSSATGVTQALTTSPPTGTAPNTPVARLQAVITVVSQLSGFVTNQFSLSYNGATTPLMVTSSTAAAVQAALIALFPQFTALDFNVTGAAGGPWTVTYPGGSLLIAATTTNSTSPPTAPVMTIEPLIIGTAVGNT
jgi:hypothetical protein